MEDRGNSAGVKSKAEDIEYDLCPPYRLAGVALLRGSSFSSDSFRDDATPDREDDSEGNSAPSESSARDASSSESRPGTCKGFWISE